MTQPSGNLPQRLRPSGDLTVYRASNPGGALVLAVAAPVEQAPIHCTNYVTRASERA